MHHFGNYSGYRPRIEVLEPEDKCEIRNSQSLDFPNAWDSLKHNKIHEEQHTE